MTDDVGATLQAARAIVVERGWRPVWFRGPGVTVDGAVYTAARLPDGTAPTLAPALKALRVTARRNVWAASDRCGSTTNAVRWIDHAIVYLDNCPSGQLSIWPDVNVGGSDVRQLRCPGQS